jgi:hypothetical protein
MVTVQMLGPGGRLDGFNSAARTLQEVSHTTGAPHGAFHSAFMQHHL